MAQVPAVTIEQAVVGVHFTVFVHSVTAIITQISIL